GGHYRLGGSRQRAARADAALHTAASSAGTAPARAVRAHQRERLGRADRPPGWGRPDAPGNDREVLSAARSRDPRAHRRLGRADGPRARGPRAPGTRTRATAGGAVARGAPTDPGVRWRAQEHLLPAEGALRVPLAPRRRSRELRDHA